MNAKWHIAAGIALTAVFATGPVAAADGPPDYLKETLPEHAIDEMVAGWAAVQGEGAALDAKTRELIALGVAAQIPCRYCVHGHTLRAKAEGATEAEVREAVATAGYIRLWSTVLNGHNYDFDAFTAELDQMVSAN